MLRHEHVLLQHAQSAEYGKQPTQNGQKCVLELRRPLYSGRRNSVRIFEKGFWMGLSSAFWLGLYNLQCANDGDNHTNGAPSPPRELTSAVWGLRRWAQHRLNTHLSFHIGRVVRRLVHYIRLLSEDYCASNVVSELCHCGKIHPRLNDEELRVGASYQPNNDIHAQS